MNEPISALHMWMEMEEEMERLRNALKHIASRYEESESALTWMTAWAMHSDAIQALEEGYEFGDRGYNERRSNSATT